MSAVSSPDFVVELPLGVGSDLERFLKRTFEYGRNLHNATLGSVLGRAQRLRESKARPTRAALSGSPALEPSCG